MKQVTDKREKLARRICWLEFPRRGRKFIGATEAAYWMGLPEETKERFRHEARRLQWLLAEFDRSKDCWALLDR